MLLGYTLAPQSGESIVVSTAQAEFKQNDDNILLLYSAADKSKAPVSAEEIFISFNAIVDDLELVADFGIRIKCINDNAVTSALASRSLLK